MDPQRESTEVNNNSENKDSQQHMIVPKLQMSTSKMTPMQEQSLNPNDGGEPLTKTQDSVPSTTSFNDVLLDLKKCDSGFMRILKSLDETNETISESIVRHHQDMKNLSQRVTFTQIILAVQFIVVGILIFKDELRGIWAPQPPPTIWQSFGNFFKYLFGYQ